MNNFFSVLSLNSNHLYNVFNKDTLKQIPQKIANSPYKDTLAKISMGCAIIIAPFYVYKKFMANKTNEASIINSKPLIDIRSVANNAIVMSTLETVTAISNNKTVEEAKKTQNKSDLPDSQLTEEKTQKENRVEEDQERKLIPPFKK